jgi:hypothetical protein
MNKTGIYLIPCLFLILPQETAFCQTLEAHRTFITTEARQGIAVGREHFYAVNSTSLGKFDKVTGKLISAWKDSSKRIIHFDGAVVVDDTLYCAHSNYPGIPMTSSVEVFSADLRHLYSHSFGIKYGSCTWADFYNGSWWVCFANYDQFEKQTGRNTSWTVLIRYDRHWNETGSWTFPESVISELMPMSCSGGSWGPDGNLYVTGHDSSKVYLLQLPDMGSALEHIKYLEATIEGQGIAWDRFDRNKLWGIIRRENKVVVSILIQENK